MNLYYLDNTKAQTILLTGLSGSGKTTLGIALHKKLLNNNYNTVFIDGDFFRKGVSNDLRYSLEDREENIRRLAETCKLLNTNNIHVIASFIAPTQSLRNIIKNTVNNYIEAYINCTIDTCIKRDPKKLYRKNIRNFTGIDQEYEVPLEPDVTITTEVWTVPECTYVLFDTFKKKLNS
jgi:adenylylsulfate kinase